MSDLFNRQKHLLVPFCQKNWPLLLTSKGKNLYKLSQSPLNIFFSIELKKNSLNIKKIEENEIAHSNKRSHIYVGTLFKILQLCGPIVIHSLDGDENHIPLCAQFLQDVLLVIQEIPEILRVNLRCLLAELITDFCPCDMKVLLLYVSFNPVAFLQITVMNNFYSLWMSYKEDLMLLLTLLKLHINL